MIFLSYLMRRWKQIKIKLTYNFFLKLYFNLILMDLLPSLQQCQSSFLLRKRFFTLLSMAMERGTYFFLGLDRSWLLLLLLEELELLEERDELPELLDDERDDDRDELLSDELEILHHTNINKKLSLCIFITL